MKANFRNYYRSYSKYSNSNNYKNNKFNNDYKKEKFIKFNDSEEKLKHISTIIENNNKQISNITPWNETYYFTAYKNEFIFRTIGQDNSSDKGNLPENCIIRKAIFFNDKIIMLVENIDINGNNDKVNTYYLIVMKKINNKFQFFYCKINSEPYDMIEDSNYIIISGNNLISIFYFDQSNNGQIAKITEIILNQNNNNDNNDIFKALCIEKTDQSIICGHSLGYISKWVRIENNPFIENSKASRIHLDSINKILYDINNDNIKVIISCSSDKTLKVHTLDDFVCLKILNFTEEVTDLKKVNNHDNQTNYFVNLKNSNLILYDSEFNNKLLEIYNNSKINRNFICLSSNDNINNNNNNNINRKRIYVLITEENKIEIYEWIKQDKNNDNDKTKKKYANKRNGF